MSTSDSTNSIYVDPSGLEVSTGVTIAGGKSNTAGTTGVVKYATIGGGLENIVNADYTTIAGGGQNTVDSTFGSIGGGFNNEIYAKHGAIGGGTQNQVRGRYGAIPGGTHNAINSRADYSFAAGTRTTVDHSNSAAFGFSSGLDASNLCQTTEDGQILMCADSLDLSKVSRIDWGDHLQSALTKVTSAAGSDVEDIPTSTTTTVSYAPQPSTQVDPWYLSPILFIVIGVFVALAIPIGILFAKFTSHSKLPAAHHIV